MRNFLVKTLVGSSLLLVSLTARAQYPPRYDDPYRSDRGYDNGYQHRGWVVTRSLNRLRADLDRADANTVPFVSDFNGDRERISRARQELSEFQQSWSAREFNARQVDGAIYALQRVLDQNHLTDRNRSMLASDLAWMRDFRDRHEQ